VAAGIYRFQLGRECIRQIEHLRVLLQLEINYDLWDKKEVYFCST
jgi:hypothetical protein